MGIDISRNLSVISHGLKSTGVRALKVRANKLAHEALNTAVELAAEAVESRDGTYLSSFTVTPATQHGDSRVRFTLGNTAPYAGVIEYGVNHSWKIGPRNKKALAWPGSRSATGFDVLLRRGETVTHPAMEGHFVITRAMNSVVQRQRGFGRAGR